MKIHMICGPGGSGKDTLRNELIRRHNDVLFLDIPYTTRPIRPGEINGVDYFFRENPPEESVSQSEILDLRKYPTKHGDWYYWHQKIHPEQSPFVISNILTVSTMDTIQAYSDAYGANNTYVYYLDVDPCTLLHRMISRENTKSKPDFAEVARRFISDYDIRSEQLSWKIPDGVSYNRIDANSSIDDVRNTVERIMFYGA